MLPGTCQTDVHWRRKLNVRTRVTGQWLHTRCNCKELYWSKPHAMHRTKVQLCLYAIANTASRTMCRLFPRTLGRCTAVVTGRVLTGEPRLLGWDLAGLSSVHCRGPLCRCLASAGSWTAACCLVAWVTWDMVTVNINDVTLMLTSRSALTFIVVAS